ncbi:MAG TPA: RHS repeat-associated core domain-containing protein [Pyrinomonadaceae bacterium]|nr:RHS repeat-associated core domain-containing protein [Pyrinomonadaceae bacterium]
MAPSGWHPPGLPNSNTATINLILIGNDDWQNAGRSACPKNYVGQPINVTNGNMWIEQSDYLLPGKGPRIEITRFYNSIRQSSGLFGFGWTTRYDRRIEPFPDDKVIRLVEPDGRAYYFGRELTNIPFRSFSPDMAADIVKNPDGTYSLTKKGEIFRFSQGGALLWEKDNAGNQSNLTYDTAGRLSSITDPAGRVLNITLNPNGNVSQIADTTGIVATYAYVTGTSLLETVTYGDSSKLKFTYVTVGAKTIISTVKDALDNILESHSFDSQGRATTSVKDGNAESYSINYNGWDAGLGTYSIVTDGLGRVTSYYYKRYYGTNAIVKTVGACQACGGGSEVTEYLYDTSNSRLLLKQKKDSLGRLTKYDYDNAQNLIQLDDPLGKHKWTYNQFGEVLTYRDRVDSQDTDPNANTVTNTYDSVGNLLTTKGRLGNVTTYTYSSSGLPLTVKDALNHTTTLTWDSYGRLTKVKNADNRETNFAYDARARVTSVTNAKSETTAFEYDLNNRLKKIIYPDTSNTVFTYDLAGRRTGVTDELGHTTAYGYDSAYRLTSVTDALNHTTSYGYDLMSNLTSLTDALGNVTDYEYDAFDRLKKIKYPVASSGATRLEESFTYDSVGNLKTRVDTASRTTAYDYDQLNRLKKITDALNGQTQFEYDSRSNLTKVKDAANQEYIYTYDPLGRVLTETHAGTTMSFEYDAVGNRKKRTDHMGRVTDYTYDALNRLTNIEYNGGANNPVPDSQAAYSYDELSRLVSAVNNAGTVSFTYDTRDRLKTETDVFGHVVEYGYDAGNRRTTMKLDSASYATYAYDIANRLTGITNASDSATINFSYDNANRLTSRTYPNGVATNYEYDGMSRLKRIKDDGPSSTLFDRQYSYNDANQISQIADLTGTKVFGYDNLDRLTSMTNGVTNESYAFDAVGNRISSHLSSSYSYSPFNRLSSTQTSTQNFDADGNTIRKSEGSSFWRYTWNYENRLTGADTRKDKVRYIYDALGRRVMRKAGPKGFTKYTYDGFDVVMDDDRENGVTKYLNGMGIDNKLRSTNGGNASYFLADHLGSTNGLVDVSGTLKASNSYDSFGNPTNADFPTRYQFTGREYDSYTGLQYSRARFYDPKIGRFISEDPIGFRGGDVNFYGYVRNQPYIYRDTLGLYPGGDVLADPSVWRSVGAGLGTVGGALAAAASSPAAVAAGGFAAGYGIGYYPGQWTANHPSNPFVNGPLNPWGTPIPALPPWTPTAPSGPVCQPLPKPIPWFRDRTDSWPSDPPNDRDGCAQEWADAFEWCANNIGKSDQRGGSGGYSDLYSCARGRVSQRCGGNRLDWGR